MTQWEEVQPRFLKTLLTADEDGAIALTREALEGGASPLEIFDQCISPSLQTVGKKFETLEIYLPEMVTAADIVERVNTDVINPAVEESGLEGRKSPGKVLLATVQGDLHDIGKNMVGLLLKVNGFEVIDLGTNVSPSDIMERAEQEKVDIIGMSALLTTCLPYMKDVADFLEGKGIRGDFNVIIGGAATNPVFAEEVGANAHGGSAAEGVEKCKMLMGGV